MIDAWLTAIAVCCVIIAATALCLAALGVRAAWCRARDWWGCARDVIRLTQDEAALQAIREAGYRAFDEHVAGALALVRTDDWDEALERLVIQEGTEQ
jgi:hypothetical protein